ncbi:glycosyltransferase family 4 protein [Paenibacillus beijingensis]|uniref:Glycosyltransferase n=1 Tax=Paenibacillus beijingensis TaxID=1126833 RepID=A0A0D5NKE7_9BACL|nr:glycosyltransferase family 4 protein [Paenibacillus beijingensis]AJY75711.1 hypothetical protein VN24_15565 [Paenibacillus beijingensis]
MKILIVCSDFPYPANHGARVDTWGRIKVLHEMGWEIHLIVCGKIAPSQEDLDVVNSYVDEVQICNRRSKLLDLLHVFPMQVKSRDELHKANISADYDYVLLEGDYVYPILKHPNIRNGSVILRVHNDEALYFQSLAKSTRNMIHKFYYYIESKKFEVLQKKILEDIDKYLFISNKEYEKFIRMHPSAKSKFLPPPITQESFKASSFQHKHVVFIGSLFMPNNREAIEWYLKYVHPRLLQERDYKFVVAGNSRGQSLSWLENYNLTNVIVHDTPKSLDDIYSSGYLFVNPMQNGAGVKMKTIEAIQNGLPVVSTSVGCEGTGLVNGRDILVADDAEGFYQHIQQLLDNPMQARKLLDASQNFIRLNYDHKEVLNGFIGSLSTSYQMEQVL